MANKKQSTTKLSVRIVCGALAGLMVLGCAYLLIQLLLF